MALSKSNITVILREISLKNRPDELYRISPKGTVPVLYTNNRVIDESLEIMLWSIKKTDCDWLDIDFENQMKVINQNDNDFKAWLDKYKYSSRYPNKSQEFYQEKCRMHLNVYEKILSGNIYLTGEKQQLVDIAIFPFVRQCENVDSAWFKDSLPNLYKWLNEIKISQLFLSVMKKYDFWNESNEGKVVSFNL